MGDDNATLVGVFADHAEGRVVYEDTNVGVNGNDYGRIRCALPTGEWESASIEWIMLKWNDVATLHDIHGDGESCYIEIDRDGQDVFRGAVKRIFNTVDDSLTGTAPSTWACSWDWRDFEHFRVHPGDTIDIFRPAGGDNVSETADADVAIGLMAVAW